MIMHTDVYVLCGYITHTVVATMSSLNENQFLLYQWSDFHILYIISYKYFYLVTDVLHTCFLYVLSVLLRKLPWMKNIILFFNERWVVCFRLYIYVHAFYDYMICLVIFVFLFFVFLVHLFYTFLWHFPSKFSTEFYCISFSKVSLLLCFDPLTRSKMPFRVMHRKEVTHSNGSYERKSCGWKLADEMGRGKKNPIILS